VTLLVVGLPGTREQTLVKAARESLMEDMEVLRQNPLFSRVGLTGSAFIREGQLDATTKSLRRSLPVAAGAALVLLILMMRSLRYAVVTIIPVLLVAVWLYALMYLIGFSLNFVTATIGAISIGVGIDYSIHMTERFREELRRNDTNMEALRRAASGTGVALMASAVSSIVGFVILGFAPMPLFSSFGFLTAIMIFLVLASSLVVLPSLLLLVTPEKTAQGASTAG
jgi:predicted RND superfamily exporter protein